MFALFSQGVSIAFAAAFSPGPLLIFLVMQTLRHGWRHAIWIILAPLLSDGPVVLAVLLILNTANDLLEGAALDTLERILGLVGGAFILYIAWGVWKQLRSGAALIDTESAAATSDVDTPWRSLRHAAGMNFFSPNPWLFWGTAMGKIVLEALRTDPASALAFIAGFYSTFLLIMAAQVALFQQARRFGPQVMRYALWAGLVILVGFGLSLWAGALFPGAAA